MASYKILGLMSGTSLDGLDMALCHLDEAGGRWQFSIEQTKDVPYTQKMRDSLGNAISLSDNDHMRLHREYGAWLGGQAKKFMEERRLEVDFIASHGHTSHHRPDQGITFQLGDGQLLANSSGVRVVCDFRWKDVSLGGQGAPLVPIGDQLLFPQYDFCLNLGGISNISFEWEGKRIAFDIGLANMPLNHIARSMGLDYDENGELARSGSLDSLLLERLDRLDYYRLPHPKSTGYEWFVAEIIPLMEASNRPKIDQLHTFVHHNCGQISDVVHKYSRGGKAKLLATGGGALNPFFMEILQERLGSRIEVAIPDRDLIAYKEALIFALMGALRMEGKINVLRSVTGAREDSCSGVLYLPEGV